jgi:F0F1-type ATP synthase membrane subunit b/b'
MKRRETIRKLIAGTLVGLSSILLVLSIAGIVLAWVYNEPLTQEATSRLKEIDTELAQAQTALENAKTELERTLRIVETAEKTLAALKDELAQAKELFGEVNGTLDEQLIPGLKSSREKVNQARSALQDLRNTLEQINELPFLNFDIPGDKLLTNLIGIADSIDAEIARVEKLAQKASTFTEDVSYLMGGDLTETKQNLQNFLAVVNEYDQKVTDWRAQVKMLLESLPGWIDRASIILTVFLLWFGVSQFGLFLHGLTIWRGGDPLAGLREAWKEARLKRLADDIEI